MAMTEAEFDKIAEAKRKNEALPARCENCGLGFDIDEDGCPNSCTARWAR